MTSTRLRDLARHLLHRFVTLGTASLLIVTVAPVAGGSGAAASAETVDFSSRMAEPIEAAERPEPGTRDAEPDFEVPPEDESGSGGLLMPLSVATIPVVEPYGDQIRTLRLALAATGGFSAKFFGDATTDAEKRQNVHDELDRAVARLNEVYEAELGVRFELVPNNDDLIFLDAVTDDYVDTNNRTDADRNQDVVDRVIGTANYDIGHVLTAKSGGNAILGAVGRSAYKADGASGISGSTTGDPFYVDTLAHEIGHMFGANHTYTSCAGDPVELDQGVEPGSGTTIMGYAGTCGGIEDVQDHSDPYFSAVSLYEMRTYMADATKFGNAGTLSGANTIPSLDVVPALSSFAIPPRTPFVLTAAGSDPDAGANLTYAWEQMDTATSESQLISLDTEPKPAPVPLFRSRISSSPERYFPDLSMTLAGTTNQATGSCLALSGEVEKACLAEFLPTTARTMDFRATVRDGQGGVRSTQVDVVVTGSTPFAITSPANATVYLAGSTQTITWDTAGTESWSPAFSTVDILASTDGGTTWSVLADGTANDGTQSVTLPSVVSSQLRFKVQPEGAIFFDVSDGNSSTYLAGENGAPDSPTGVSATRGNGQAVITWTAPVSTGASAITGYEVTASPGASTCASTSATTCTVTGLTNGTAYTFTVTATNSNGTSPASGPSAAVTPATRPDPPTAVTVVAGNGSARVSWSPPASDGGSPIFEYAVWASISGDDNTNYCLTTVTTYCTVTGLTNGTAYTFRVYAENEVRQGYGSTATSPVTPATVPDAPTSVAATAGDGTAVVTWTAPSSTGGAAIDSYTVTSSPDARTCSTATTSCTVTGLANGTPYTFTVTATNRVGEGASSTASASVTPTSALPAQTIDFANPGTQLFSGSLTVTATASSSLAVSFSSSTPSVCSVTSGGAVTFVSSGTCTLVASQAGDGSWAAATPVSQSFTVSAVAPDTPTSVSAVRGDAQATVSWTAPASDGGSSITTYTVTSSPDGITASGSSTAVTVTGLTNGTAYTFTVTATSAAGLTSSASSASAAVTPEAVVTAPGAPQSVAATRGNGQAVVSWTAPVSDGGSAITGYQLEQRAGSGSWSVVAASTTTNPYTVTGLTNGTSYTFRVSAINTIGTGSAAAGTAVTPATVPSEPTTVQGTSSSGRVIVSWNAPISTGGAAISQYVVTASPGGATCTTSLTTCVVTGLSNGTAYTFTVVASNVIGSSQASTSSEPVTPAAASPESGGGSSGGGNSSGSSGGVAAPVLSPVPEVTAVPSATEPVRSPVATSPVNVSQETTPQQVATFTAAVTSMLTGEQLARLRPDALAALSPEAAAAIPVATISFIKPQQAAAIAPLTIAALTPVQVAALPTKAVAALRPRAIAALEPEQVAALPAKSVASLKPRQMVQLSSDAISSMKRSQVKAITPRALSAMNTQQLAALSSSTVVTLRPVQIRKLSRAQIRALGLDGILSRLSPSRQRAVKAALRG